MYKRTESKKFLLLSAKFVTERAYTKSIRLSCKKPQEATSDCFAVMKNTLCIKGLGELVLKYSYF